MAFHYLSDLAEEHQAKVLAKHPDFNDKPGDEQQAILSKAKSSINRTEKNKRVTKGKIDSTIRSVAESLAEKSADDTDAPKSRRGKRKTSGVTEGERVGPDFTPEAGESLDPDSPFNADGLKHHHALANIGNFLDRHTVRLEKKEDTPEEEVYSPSDISQKITDGHEALSAAHMFQLYDKTSHAAAKLKEAAGHYSTAERMITQRYGAEALPKIKGMTAGEHAVGVANDYSRENHAGIVSKSELDVNSSQMNRAYLRHALKLPLEDIDLKKLARAAKKAEGTSQAPKDEDKNTGKDKETHLQRAQGRRTVEERSTLLNAALEGLQARRARAESGQPAEVEAPKPKPASDVFVEPAANRYLGRLSKFGPSGSPVVHQENQEEFRKLATRAIKHLRIGKPVPNFIRMSLGTAGMEQVRKVHQSYLDKQEQAQRASSRSSAFTQGKTEHEVVTDSRDAMYEPDVEEQEKGR
jgi:hypothetical protein